MKLVHFVRDISTPISFVIITIISSYEVEEYHDREKRTQLTTNKKPCYKMGGDKGFGENNGFLSLMFLKRRDTQESKLMARVLACPYFFPIFIDFDSA
jgi:hypothetical protein